MVGFYKQSFAVMSFSVTCKNGCAEDATGAGCLPAIDQTPAHTCSSDADCPPTPTRCMSDAPGKKTTWNKPVCSAGACEWAYSTTSDCPTGTTCTTDKPCGE